MVNQEDNIQLPQVQQNSQSDDSDDSQRVDIPTPQQTSNSGNPLTASDSQVITPDAGDVDLIEKEWVEKAKSIVNGTLGDPHTQSEKISQMKADYIRKRFNKEIRAEDK